MATAAAHQEEDQALIDRRELERLAELPFAQQIAWLDERLERGDGPGALLTLASELRDHEPAGRLLSRLCQRGELALPEVRVALREALTSGPETRAQRLLASLARAPSEAARDAVQVVLEAIDASPFERLAALCLMDRWLGEAAPATRASRRAEAVAAAEQAIDAGEVSSLSDERLVGLPGHALPSLDERAGKAGCQQAWRARLSAFATRVLDRLEAAPRSLSQANAERLLSRSVYEAPGHFLTELLQNAEDSGASLFRVEVDEGEVRVFHDGAPFDARDVVGVLSIGQSTKVGGQIGLFGVGFKAVHQITDRPRVYSGPFSFEIRSVSLPRRLGAREGAEGPRGTWLVLPRRDGALSAGQIAGYARAIPAPTLLALRSVSAIEVEGPGGPRRVRIERGEGEASLVDETAGARERLLFERDGEALVGVWLDERGEPSPAPPGEPTVYCFLPTAERSGLRILVHARLDVPLDRERVDRDSSRNHRAFLRAGGLLARLAGRLAAPGEGARLERLLSLVPAPGELAAPVFARLAEGFVAEARSLRLVGLPSGEREVASRVALSPSPELALSLSGLEVLAHGSTRRVAELPADPRVGAVLRRLGAVDLDARALADLGRRLLSSGHPGAEGNEGSEGASRWARVLPHALSLLASSPDEARSLAELPWLLDQAGAPRRPDELRVAPGELRALYGLARPLLSPSLEASLGGFAAASTLLARLGVGSLSAPDLVADLGDREMARAMVGERGEGAGPLLSYLASQPQAVRQAAASKPFVPDERGELGPLSGEGACFLPPAGELGAWLSRLTSPRPSLVAPALAASHEGELVSLGASRLDLGSIVARLAGRSITPSAAEARGLLSLLDRDRDELSPRLCEALARAPVFEDSSGQLRPVSGPGAALLPESDELCSLLEPLPWLSPWARALGLLERVPHGTIGAAQAALALLSEGPARPAPGSPLPLVRFVAARADRLSSSLRARLIEAPLVPGPSGLAPLGALRLAPTDPAVARVYALWPARPLAPEGGWVEAARALGAPCAPLDHASLIDDLVAADAGWASQEGELAEAIADALASAARALPPSALAPLLDRPLFEPDPASRARAGERARVLPWGSSGVGLRRASPELRALLLLAGEPLLSERDEARFAPLFDACHIGRAGLAELCSAVEGPLSGRDGGAAEARRALSALAVEAKRASASIRNRLAALAIWPSRSGALSRATGLALAGPLEALSGLASPGPLADPFVLAPSAEPELASLSGVIDPADPAEALARVVEANLVAGEPLASQPPFARSVEALASLFGTLAGRLPEARLLALPLVLGADGRVASGRKHRVPRGEEGLLLALGLGSMAADPAFAEQVASIDPSRITPLPAFRICEALARLLPEPVPPAEAGALSSPSQRASLYQALLARAAEIEAEPRAWGPLGNACFVPASGGLLRPPRQLLLDDRLPALPLEGRPDRELPSGLRALFARLYRLDEGRLRVLSSSLADLNERAAEVGDGPLALAALGALSRALGLSPGMAPVRDLDEKLRSLKLARRARVEASRGGFLRARELCLLEGERAELVEQFHPEPPPRPLEQPGPFEGSLDDALPLLRALGAPDELGEAELSAMLRGEARLLPGDGSRLSLARYVAAVAIEHRELRESLSLDRARWVPSAAMGLERPADLFWPSPTLTALVGERPEARVHPEIALTAPPELSSWLRFKGLDDVPLAWATEPVAAGELASDALLSWLERGLSAGRLVAADVRRAFGDARALRDERGEPRAPFELASPEAKRGHDERPRWADEHRFARLGAALKVGRRPSPPRPEPAEAPAPPPARAPARAPAEPPRKGKPAAPKAGERAGSQARRETPGDGDEPGLMDKMKKWFLGESPEPAPAEPPRKDGPARQPAARRAEPEREAPRASPASPALPASPAARGAGADEQRQRGWFRPSDTLEAQLGVDPGFGRRGDDPAAYGLLASPSPLPPPYLYAPQRLLGSFDPGGQRWAPVSLPRGLSDAGAGRAGEVAMSGRLPSGEVQLPLPLYGKLVSAESEARGARPFVARDGRQMVVLPKAGAFRCSVVLGEAPRFLEEPPPAPASPHDFTLLLAPTASDDELPGEGLSFVRSLVASGVGALERATRVRDFVRARYRYDPSYLEDPSLGRWLERTTRGKSNVHLAALHAGCDARHLGAGVCYELNALVCELLRRAEIPSLIATGWVLDGTPLTEPDHLWAMAVLPSHLGPRLLPIDAASTVEGRPIRAPARPASSLGPAPAAPSQAPEAPSWARQGRPDAIPRGSTQSPPARGSSPTAAEIVRMIRFLEEAAGERPSDERAIRRRAEALAADPAALRRLLSAMRG